MLTLLKPNETPSTSYSSLPSQPLLLTYHVTYWDSLGWKDTFARQTFNDRQHDYVKRLRLESAFTPQVVVNGKASGLVTGMDELRGLVERGQSKEESNAKGASGVRVEVEDDLADGHPCEEAMIKVSRGEDVEGDLDLWLVKYDPRAVQVGILAGENAGRSLPYQNLVRSIERVGFFGAEESQGSFLVDMVGRGDLRLVVLVQQGYGGSIVGAVIL